MFMKFIGEVGLRTRSIRLYFRTDAYSDPASYIQDQFLACVSHTAHVIAMLSVCLSVTRWYYVQTAQPIEYRQTVFTA